jgi:hypothetical protein
MDKITIKTLIWTQIIVLFQQNKVLGMLILSGFNYRNNLCFRRWNDSEVEWCSIALLLSVVGVVLYLADRPFIWMKEGSPMFSNEVFFLPVIAVNHILDLDLK